MPCECCCSCRWLLSRRWILCYVGFGVFFFLHATRVNLSVAIVCMVRDTILNSTDYDLNQSLIYNNTLLTMDRSENVMEQYNDSLENDETCSADDVDKTYNHSKRFEFSWDKQEQTWILSMYFIGYLLGTLPSGRLSIVVGGKRLISLGLLLSAAATLLVPWCTRMNTAFIYALRIIAGIGGSFYYPAMQTLWGKWAPPEERGVLTTICYTGRNVGSIATFALSGFLCAHGFDNGWGSIFYITGFGSLLWSFVWAFTVAEKPRLHQDITERELEFITGNLEDNPETPGDAPFWEILKSTPAWAVLVCEGVADWKSFCLLTTLPLYMKEVLNFSIEENGFLTAMPYVALAISSPFGGYLQDLLVKKKILSKLATRKIFVITSFLGSGGCLVGLGFLTCETRYIGVALLILCMTFEGMVESTYPTNQVELAPRFSGVLTSHGNILASIGGLMAPVIVGAMTPNKSQEEWRNTFYLTFALCLFGSLFYFIFADAKVQPWAKDPVTATPDKDTVTTSPDKDSVTATPDKHNDAGKDVNNHENQVEKF